MLGTIITIIIIIIILAFLYNKFWVTPHLEKYEIIVQKILEMSNINKKISVKKSYYSNHIAWIENDLIYLKDDNMEDLIYNLSKICSDENNFYDRLEEFTYNASVLGYYKKIN